MDVSETLFFKTQLRQERIRRNWRQQDLADELGTTVTTVKRWERGSQQPSAYFCTKLCTLFGKSAEELGLLPEENCMGSEQQRKVSAHNLDTISIQETHENTSLSAHTDECSHEHLLAAGTQDYKQLSAMNVFSSRYDRYTQPQQRLVIANQDRLFRHRMLIKVHSLWIKDIFEPTFSEVPFIIPHLQRKDEAVIQAWDHILHLSHEPQTITPGTTIIDVYNATEELLILGEPGAGKTLLLLELTRHLLRRATQDEEHPIPVVFHLSSWVEKHYSLARWLIEELQSRYQVPPLLSRKWMKYNQILPLLDGLDGVSLSCRAACVRAMNAYRQEHGLFPFVVCSRSAEYQEQPQRLRLQRAIEVLPFTLQQQELYLSSKGEAIAALRQALYDDPILQKIAANPFTLNMLTHACYRQYEEHHLSSSFDERKDTFLSYETKRAYVYKAYIQRIHDQPCVKRDCSQVYAWPWLAHLTQQYRVTFSKVSILSKEWLVERRGSRNSSAYIGWLLRLLIVVLICMSIASAFLNPVKGLLLLLLIRIMSGHRAISSRRESNIFLLQNPPLRMGSAYQQTD